MNKKRKALIIVLALFLVASGVLLAVTFLNVAKAKEQEAALKAENEKTYISDLFHDQGSVYMTPTEPEEGEQVTLRLRTQRYNVTRAQIQYTTDKGETWETANMEFEKQDDTGYYDVWKGQIVAEGELVYYRFIATNKDNLSTVYYDTKGADAKEGHYSQGWQIVPGHKVPEWAKGATWYSLMPDAFYNGNTTNDKQISGENTYASWNQLHKGLQDRYGGDLQGVENKLDYIESLNVDAIYMNPIFKTYQNAGYGTLHFDEIDSAYGNEEDLASLADSIHERDMKLMGDVVLTFSPQNSYYFNEDGRWPVVGAAESEDSEWNSMYKWFDWPNNYMRTWDSPAIDLNTDTAKELLYSKDNSYLLKYANIFDGYRFDCGGWLWGTTETDDVDAYTFVKEIREALHKENEDFYLLAEADWTNANTGTWDSMWNLSYMPKLQDYAKGLINETLMTEAMYEFERTIPRNVALCLLNMMCQHDDYRVVQHDDYMYNAALLIQMTYLGSPSIYYGEEVDYIRETEDGIGTVQSFYSMDWDESNWDQARLNFYKATTELRQEYSCIKTGVVNMLESDVENNVISYGRWDENGAAITVTSQNENMITVDVQVSKCDIKDGTVMTDWYTGKQYVVKDGKITADIIPGGTVIVTGKKSSTYRQAYVQTQIGNASKHNSILTKDTLSFETEGKGNITGSKDKLTFANTVAYDAFSVFANLRGDGSSVLMVRNSNDADSQYYSAMVKGDKLSIIARADAGDKAEVLVKVDCTKNTYVKIERTGNNEFSAYKAEVQDGNLGAWELIEGSTVALNMDNRVLYGFAPLKGNARVNNLTLEQLEKSSLFDTFDGESSTALFDNVNADFVSIEDGKLTITNSKKETLNYLLTNSMEDDWTFKTKLNFNPAEGEYAGVVSKQDENNYIIAGRTKVDGKQMLFLGKNANNALTICASVEAPKGDAIIQLQRAGAYYTAIYSIDEGATWKYIGKVYTNYSCERVGILVSGKGKATFDWVSFGDSINDGVSYNTPHTPIEVDTTYTNRSTDKECAYEFLTGTWSLVTGGWNQKNKNVFAQASATNKVFSGLYAEATIDIIEGNGWAGLAFGKSAPDTVANDGFILKYFDGGKLILTNAGKQIAECKVKVSKEEAMRVVIEASEGKIVVYAGQEAKPVMTVNDTTYESGYVSFCTDGVEADFRNFHHGSTNATWNWVSGNGTGSGQLLSTFDTSTEERQIHSVASLSGYSFTNFVCTAKLSVVKGNEELACASGLLLCTSEGRSASVDGVFVHLDGTGNLVLTVDGVQRASYELQDKTASAFIMVTKQDGVYQVYLKGVDSPVLEYSEKFNRGGAFSIYTINGNGTFANVAIENLQHGQDYSTSNLAATWGKESAKGFRDNFNSDDSINNYYLYNTNTGTFEVQDGVLRCYEPNDWIAGATIMNDIYSDFAMNFKLRIDSQLSGWMSVGIRKDMPNGNHNNSGVSLMIGSNGDVFFFDSATQKEISRGKINNFSIEEWYDVKIVANGSRIDAYVNGVKVLSCKNVPYVEGFISFTSGMHEFSIDELEITPKQ